MTGIIVDARSDGRATEFDLPEAHTLADVLLSTKVDVPPPEAMDWIGVGQRGPDYRSTRILLHDLRPEQLSLIVMPQPGPVRICISSGVIQASGPLWVFFMGRVLVRTASLRRNLGGAARDLAALAVEMPRACWRMTVRWLPKVLRKCCHAGT